MYKHNAILTRAQFIPTNNSPVAPVDLPSLREKKETSYYVPIYRRFINDYIVHLHVKYCIIQCTVTFLALTLIHHTGNITYCCCETYGLYTGSDTFNRTLTREKKMINTACTLPKIL